MQTDATSYEPTRYERRFAPRPRRAAAGSAAGPGGRRTLTCARCPQDNPQPAKPGQAYCRSCHAAYNREWNAEQRKAKLAMQAELEELRARVGIAS
jgi:hypothetical protein